MGRRLVYQLDHDKDVRDRLPASCALRSHACLPPFLHSLSWGEQAARSSIHVPQPHACQPPGGNGWPVLSIGQRLRKPAPPTQPGNDRCHYRIQPLILSEPCLHASGPAGQLLQVRAVQSNVIVFYHAYTVPAGSTSIGIADVGTSPVGQPLPRSVPFSLIFSTWQCSHESAPFAQPGEGKIVVQCNRLALHPSAYVRINLPCSTNF
jgi:hypothetical protein